MEMCLWVIIRGGGDVSGVYGPRCLSGGSVHPLFVDWGFLEMGQVNGWDWMESELVSNSQFTRV